MEHYPGEVINENPRLLTQAFVGMCTWLYRWYQPGEPVNPEEIIRVFTRVLETGLSSSKTQPDNGAVVHSLRHVEQSLREVQKEVAKVSQQLHQNAKRPRA